MKQTIFKTALALLTIASLSAQAELRPCLATSQQKTRVAEQLISARLAAKGFALVDGSIDITTSNAPSTAVIPFVNFGAFIIHGTARAMQIENLTYVATNGSALFKGTFFFVTLDGYAMGNSSEEGAVHVESCLNRGYVVMGVMSNLTGRIELNLTQIQN